MVASRCSTPAPGAVGWWASDRCLDRSNYQSLAYGDGRGSAQDDDARSLCPRGRRVSQESVRGVCQRARSTQSPGGALPWLGSCIRLFLCWGCEDRAASLSGVDESATTAECVGGVYCEGIDCGALFHPGESHASKRSRSVEKRRSHL